jgi:hypothetical protein
MPSPDHGSSSTSTLEALQLERMVRHEVVSQLEREQKILRDSAGMALKILGASIALFLAIFTLFGLTAWSEIKKQVAGIVTQQAEGLIVKADSETNLKETLNNNLNRTIVAAHLASAASGKSSRALAANDQDRLRQWLTNEKLPLQDFSDALALLNTQSEDSKRTDSRLLAEMLTPSPTSHLRWIARQQAKVEAILRNFKHRDLGLAATDLFASEAFSDAIRSQAATYVAEVGYVEGTEKLLQHYEQLRWSAAKRSAIVAAFTLRPQDADVLLRVKEILNEDPDNDRLIVAQNLIHSMATKQSVRQAFGNKEFLAAAKQIMNFGFKNGVYFRFVNVGDVKDSEEKLSEPYVLLSRMGPPDQRASVRLSVSDFNSLDPYFEVLADLAAKGDMDQLRAVVPVSRRAMYRGDLELRVSGDSEARISVSDKGNVKREIPLKALSQVFVVRSNPIFGTAKLFWAERNGQLEEAGLTALKGKVRFSAETFR